MEYEIRHAISGDLLASVGAGSIRAALEIAVNARAHLIKNSYLESGETLDQYIKEVLPVFLTAGGKTLAEVAAGWQCHSWDNCPTAIAFGCHSLEGVPRLLQPRARQFIFLFDAGLLPNPLNEGERE